MGFKCWPLVFGLGIASSVFGQTTAPAPASMLHLPSGVDRVVIPLEAAYTLLVAKVDVDGHEGRFVVDTGSSYTAVDREIAKQWKLDLEGPGQAAGAVVPMRVLRVHRLTCGAAQFEPRVLAGIDLQGLSSMLQFPVAGILGGDLLGETPFEIDYRKRTLTIFEARRFAPPVGVRAIALRFINAIPRVEISIDGYRMDAAVDTGAAGCTLSPVPFADHPQLHEGEPTWDSLAYSLKGMTNNFDCRFASVSLLGHEPQAVWFSCSRDYHETDNIQTVSNAIGANTLEDACCTFDYASRRMWARWLPKETANQMLSRLGDPRGHDLAGMTPLMRAARAGNSEVLNALLQSGADMDAKDSIEQTALMFAAHAGNPAAIKILLSHGAHVDVSTSVGGETALHYACEQFDVDVVKELLKAGANPNAPDTHGWTPLKRAAEGNQLEIVRALLAAGADPIVADKEGFTPLIFAARRAGPALLGAMLDKLADRAPTAAGIALGFAAFDGNIENMKLLLDHGADPNFVDNNGSTPLMAAVQDDNGQAARLLLGRGADPARRSHEGKTAWDYAVAYNKFGVLRALQNAPALKDAQQ